MADEQEIERDDEEIVEAPPEPSPEEVAERQEIEATARKYGWKPETEYTLDKKGWVDADRFMALPQTQNKVLRDELKANQKAIRDYESKISKVDETVQKVAETARRQERARFDAQLAEIQRQQREAVSQGDVETFDRLREHEVRLQRAVPQQHVEAPEVPEWAKADPELGRAAFLMIEQRPDIKVMSPTRQLKWVEDRLRSEGFLPAVEQRQETQQPARTVSKVDGGGLAGGMIKRGPSFETLPADAKEAFADFVALGVYKDDEASRAKYLKTYSE